MKGSAIVRQHVFLSLVRKFLTPKQPPPKSLYATRRPRHLHTHASPSPPPAAPAHGVGGRARPDSDGQTGDSSDSGGRARDRSGAAAYQVVLRAERKRPARSLCHQPARDRWARLERAWAGAGRRAIRAMSGLNGRAGSGRGSGVRGHKACSTSSVSETPPPPPPPAAPAHGVGGWARPDCDGQAGGQIQTGGIGAGRRRTKSCCAPSESGPHVAFACSLLTTVAVRRTARAERAHVERSR